MGQVRELQDKIEELSKSRITRNTMTNKHTVSLATTKQQMLAISGLT